MGLGRTRIPTLSHTYHVWPSHHGRVGADVPSTPPPSAGPPLVGSRRTEAKPAPAAMSPRERCKRNCEVKHDDGSCLGIRTRIPISSPCPNSRESCQHLPTHRQEQCLMQCKPIQVTPAPECKGTRRRPIVDEASWEGFENRRCATTRFRVPTFEVSQRDVTESITCF